MRLRQMLKSKIHRATVTGADLHYEGSITLPPSLIVAAEMHVFEAVHIWNVTAGSRFQTYIIEGHPHSHEIWVNGAAARLVSPGDHIIIASFVMMDELLCAQHQPQVIFVDERNRVREVRAELLPDNQLS